MQGHIPSREEPVQRPAKFRTLPSFRIHLLAGMSARHAEQRFIKHFGLRLLETRVIGLVGTFGALSLKEICAESDIEKSYASRIIGRLMQRGLVEKLDSEVDQRSISVRLTEEGRSVHAALYAESVARNERWLSVLSADERQQLLATVEKLIGSTRSLLASDFLETPPPAPEPKGLPKVSLDAGLARQLHEALSAVLDTAPPAGDPP